MTDLCSGQISEGTKRVFTSAATLDDDNRLVVTLEGIIRVDDSSQLLSGYVKELDRMLSSLQVSMAFIDCTRLRFCNSTGFYAVMDILETIFAHVPGQVTIRRLSDDEWQTETLPLLLIAIGDSVVARTGYEEVTEPG